jgi:hypothetical protein
MIYPTRSVLDRSLERCKIVDDEAHTAHGACRSIGTVCFERAAERDERTRRSQRRAQITGCSLGRHGDPAEIDSLDRRARQRGVPVLPVITERSGIRWNEGCLPLRRGPIESVQERRARYRPQRCGCEHSAADEPAWDRRSHQRYHIGEPIHNPDTGESAEQLPGARLSGQFARIPAFLRSREVLSPGERS